MEALKMVGFYITHHFGFPELGEEIFILVSVRSRRMGTFQKTRESKIKKYLSLKGTECRTQGLTDLSFSFKFLEIG